MLRVLLVGYGYGGRIIHAPLIKAAGLDLAGMVSSRRDEIATAWPDTAVFSDLATALNHGEFDLAVICTPNDTHAGLAAHALDAGLHLVIDKPFAVDTAEAGAIADHAAQTGRIVTAFQNRRWDGHILTARKLLAEGAFGRISDATLSYDRVRVVNPARWGDNERRGSGIWLNLGSHLVDQAVHLFGKPSTLMADIFPQRVGAVVDDCFHVILGYQDFRVTLRACMTTPAPSPVIAIHGAKGSFVKFGEDTQEAMLKTGRVPGGEGWGIDPVPARFTPAEGETVGDARDIESGPGDYGAFYTAMAAAIRDGAPPPVAIADTLLVQHLLDLGMQSARDGRRLEVYP
ncbi:hypothetical protein ABAC460_04955 [Asticcacaulis sp. AC460]|uniref:Gfo/Idh/MocA family oxidoreductase n=1 Tax=Asticcacaulis sp. AC460 TaxID=1282360 RepID=UPI0003C3EB41|nr:Gfo/Idh/MocA family oxidoreductase [Asticcacaulis sp. AC460]ESQ91690.1 hypothetical protein ABAC460_04955 [Asticcacaulis sp. AC460]